jgi:hypothetical protein
MHCRTACLCRVPAKPPPYVATALRERIPALTQSRNSWARGSLWNASVRSTPVRSWPHSSSRVSVLCVWGHRRPVCAGHGQRVARHATMTPSGRTRGQVAWRETRARPVGRGPFGWRSWSACPCAWLSPIPPRRTRPTSSVTADHRRVRRSEARDLAGGSYVGLRQSRLQHRLRREPEAAGFTTSGWNARPLSVSKSFEPLSL